MKKSLLAAAVLSAVSFGAYADGVELYGIVDLAVANVSALSSTDPTFPSSLKLKGGVAATTTTSLSAMVSGGIQGSRWGIKGSETIGDGLSAIFALESQIQANNGNLANAWATKATGAANGDASSINGQLFGRQAWVGLKDTDMGQIRFGRNYSVIYDVYNDYDPVQFAGLFTPTGNSGSVAGGGLTEMVRQDNSIKYIGKTGDINYTLMYKLGNIAGSTSAGSITSAQLGYEKGALGIQAAYQSAIDALGYNSYTAATGSGATYVAAKYKGMVGNVSSYILGAKYKFNDALTGKITYERVTYSNPSDTDQTFLNNNFLSYLGGYSFTEVAPRSAGSSGFSVAGLGGNYNLSDKLGIYVGYYAINYDAVGGLKLTANNALNYAFTENYTSVLLDYNLSKRTDVYLGAMNVTTGQNTKPSGSDMTASSGLTIVAAGMRHKF